MSNDTQVQAHMALVDEAAIAFEAAHNMPDTIGIGGVISLLAKRDKARAAVEASARQLAEQPGFVMVPVDVLERAAESLGSFVSDHGWSDQDMQNMDNLDAFIARHKANLAARPLAASPTAPSTEASEPVRDERAPLTNDAILDAFCKTPGMNQFVQAFMAGARYAEQAHGIAARALKGTP